MTRRLEADAFDAGTSASLLRLGATTTACTLVALSLITVPLAHAQDAMPPLPRGTDDRAPNPAVVEDLAERARTQARTQAPAVDRLRQSAAAATRRTLARAVGHAPPVAEKSRRSRFVYFTSRTCAQADASLDALVKGWIDAHPEIDAEVVYLGNPLLEYADATAVFTTFADDVIARWRERLRDPAVLDALRRAGRVHDASGRVHVRFATAEAESRGITEVPAFVLVRDGRESRALGRPPSVEALEALLADSVSGARP